MSGINHPDSGGGAYVPPNLDPTLLNDELIKQKTLDDQIQTDTIQTATVDGQAAQTSRTDKPVLPLAPELTQVNSQISSAAGQTAKLAGDCLVVLQQIETFLTNAMANLGSNPKNAPQQDGQSAAPGTPASTVPADSSTTTAAPPTLMMQSRQLSGTADGSGSTSGTNGSSSASSASSTANNSAVAGGTDPKSAWFAAKCFITTFAIDSMNLARALSQMTVLQTQASISLREQERENLTGEVNSIIQRGSDEASKLDSEAKQKLVSAIVNLAFTAVELYQGSKVMSGAGTDEAKSMQYKQMQTLMEGVKSATTSISDFAFMQQQKGYITAMAGDDAMRAVTKDKYDTTVAARRSVLDFVKSLRDTLNDVLSQLVKTQEEAYRVGQFSRN